jgi:DNA N-6-adenine-methyltransferase (Dam)/Protein of unknown function (DUF3102)
VQLSQAIQQPAFDYASLDKDTAAFILQKTGQIHSLMKRTAQEIVEVGKYLLEVKERLPHGQFILWIQAEFGMSDRHARNFMHVASRFSDKTEIISDFPITILYELASPSTPESVIELVRTGEIPATVEAIRETKQSSKDTPYSQETAVSNLPIVKKTFAHLLSESNEWYTPAPYIDAARELLGGIDLDPASSAIANRIVKATTFYDIEANGLTKSWHGRVWLNPPYGKDGGESNQELWSMRLIDQYRSGITTEAVLLVNAVTDRKWFRPLWQFLICFTDHRICFYTAEGTADRPTYGNAFIYLGRQQERFCAIFDRFGVIVRRVEA